MKFAVHLYPVVRVKVVGIEAENVQAAVKIAESSVDLHALFDRARPGPANVELTEWEWAAQSVLLVEPVDNDGEVIREGSTWLDGESGEPLINEQTRDERKSLAAQAAIDFYEEVLGATETICGIAATDGEETLSDVFYLQAAILKEGCIEHLVPGKSRIQEFVTALPSADRWLKYLQQVLADPT